jgi:hypothetical protein
LQQDTNLLEIQNNAVMPDDYYTDPNKVKKIENIIKQSALLNGWDFKDIKSIDKAKLELVFNDLREK